MALRLLRLVRPHGAGRQGVAGRARGRRRDRAAERTAGQAARPGRAAHRLGTRPHLFRQPPHHARRPRPRVEGPADRRDACELSHSQRQYQGAGARRPAEARRQSPGDSVGQGRAADRRDEGPGRHGAGRRHRRPRPRDDLRRRARPEGFRETVRAKGRDDRNRSRQPAAG